MSTVWNLLNFVCDNFYLICNRPFFEISWLAKWMPMSCFEIMCESGLQSHLPKRIDVHVSDCRKRRTFFGGEGRSTGATKLILQEIKSTSSHNFHQQLVMKHWAEEIPANRPLKQLMKHWTEEIPANRPIPRCSSKNKRGKFTNTSTIGLQAACHVSLALLNLNKLDSDYKFNRIFQFCSWFMLESKRIGLDDAAFGNVWRETSLRWPRTDSWPLILA